MRFRKSKKKDREKKMAKEEENLRKVQKEKIKKQIQEAIAKKLVKPSVSALVYGYLKEKDLNLKEMSVEQWKEIEKDLVEIMLAEVYPGEEIGEEQLSFSALMDSFAFMSSFIETLNKNLEKQQKNEAGEAEEAKEKANGSGKKFEV